MVEKPIEKKDTGKESDSNLMAAISEFFGGTIVIPLILYLVKKEDNFVKFHSLQAIFFAIVVGVIAIGLMIGGGITAIAIPPVGAFLTCLTFPIYIVYLLAILLVTWKAYKGEKYKLPLIGEYAEKYSS